METSKNGVYLVACLEAIVLVSYQDGPFMSIGCGSNDPHMKPGTEITIPEVFTRLKADIKKREERINQLLEVPVEQHQYDALMALRFQSGGRYVPAMIALINAKEIKVATRLWPLCNLNFSGQEIAGLTTRRNRELKLFTDGDYGDISACYLFRGDPRDKKTVKERYVFKGDEF